MRRGFFRVAAHVRRDTPNLATPHTYGPMNASKNQKPVKTVDGQNAHHDATGKYTAKAQQDAEIVIAAPRSPGQLGGYEIRGLRERKSGYIGDFPVGSYGAFEANVYAHGKKVLTVENHGRGGETIFRKNGSYSNGSSLVKPLDDLAAKAFPDDEYADAETLVHFLDLLRKIDDWAAESPGETREEVVNDVIANSDRTFTDREKALLIDPAILDD